MLRPLRHLRWHAVLSCPSPAAPPFVETSFARGPRVRHESAPARRRSALPKPQFALPRLARARPSRLSGRAVPTIVENRFGPARKRSLRAWAATDDGVGAFDGCASSASRRSRSASGGGGPAMTRPAPPLLSRGAPLCR